jgi:hypothetical protein
MSNEDSNDKDRSTKPAADSPPPDASAPSGRRSGRVAFDSRNNPVWEWQLETGVYSRDVTTQKLKKLDLGDLSIAESAIQKRPPGLEDAVATEKGKIVRPLPGGGFNPYDSSVRPAGGDPFNKARAAVADKAAASVTRTPPRPAAARKPAVAIPPKESALSRIGSWFKGKKKTDDDEYE